jgi:hypothetical protein
MHIESPQAFYSGMTEKICLRQHHSFDRLYSYTSLEYVSSFYFFLARRSKRDAVAPTGSFELYDEIEGQSSVKKRFINFRKYFQLVTATMAVSNHRGL